MAAILSNEYRHEFSGRKWMALKEYQRHGEKRFMKKPVLEFLNNLWGLGTE
jgi:hypothetical protein